MTKPLVSVLLNSYNRPRLIRDALNSVLAQTWPNIQLIICDDYSNAETLAVIDSYRSCLHDWPEKPAHHRGWCKCVDGMFGVVKPANEPSVQERQYGQRCSVCINAGMKYATGDFVAFLPDDDFYLPRSIEVRAQYLVDHPDVNVVYGRLEACHLRNRPSAGIHRMPESRELVGPLSTWWCGDCLHDRNGFWSAEPIARAANKVDHGMMMVRRVPNLPEWPEVPTQEWFQACGHSMQSFEADGSTPRLEPQPRRTMDEVMQQLRSTIPPQETELGKPPWDYEPWASSPSGLRGAFCYTSGEEFDCPDAGFFFRCELAGLGPFHSVPDVVVVKRYGHPYGHRTDPSRRE